MGHHRQGCWDSIGPTYKRVHWASRNNRFLATFEPTNVGPVLAESS